MAVFAGREEFEARFDVSRETMERLDLYAELIARWNPRINLISRKTEPELWDRHMTDSAQLWHLRPKPAGIWADFGSGAGFPGLVLAILCAGEGGSTQFHLVESDSRKCAFLSTVARECGVPVSIDNARIEAVAPLKADVISARALAPLPQLLEFAEKHLDPEGICLFPKGETVHKEIEDALRLWQFDCRTHPSLTDSRAAILEIGAIRRA